MFRRNFTRSPVHEQSGVKRHTQNLEVVPRPKPPVEPDGKIPLKDRTRHGWLRAKNVARARHIVAPPQLPPEHCRLGGSGRGTVASN